jgi:pimeloyl-ACP methyl ester carboxylesterase/uncharacterized damage-inducible protein DinB
MDVVLVPGLWLDASSWSGVLPALERAGHRAHPVTLPGLESRTTDRSAIGLADCVAAVVAAIDAAEGPVAVVGHSAGCGVAYAAVDARVDRVARAVFVGGVPTADGDPVAGDFSPAGSDLAFPPWSEFEEADLAGLDDAARADFVARAVPSPARLATDPQRLGDPRRHDVPTTFVCTEFTGADLRGWVERDARPVREIKQLRRVRYVDVPTGHWPQFTRPGDLGRVIATAIDLPPEVAVVIDDHGRPEPPIAADEVTTLLGYLDYQRATLGWKCDVDAAGQRATTAASTMTLGGLLKHMAYVEDSWFLGDLFDRPMPPPWDAVDWSADRDWEWHSAADDSPAELFALWQTSVRRSRAATAEALADGGLDRLAQRRWPDGRAVSLRWIVCHLIEEYARHNGHADLLRESVDGDTGE